MPRDPLLERLVRYGSRRDFLAFGARASALIALGCRSGVGPLDAGWRARGAYPFTLGVASGDPLPDGVVLWTRLAPDPLEGGGMPMANVDVTWEIAEDRQFRAVAQQGHAVSRPELGHSVHVEVNGLRPGREYWYRFRAGDEVSQVGRTKTAPPAGAAVDRLRFGVCGCNHYETGYFTGLRRIAEEEFDFVF